MKKTLSPRGWVIMGLLLGAGVVLVARAPAHWLASGLASASDGRVQLLNASGTLWNGQAQLALSGGQDSVDAVSLPGRVQWSLKPSTSGLQLTVQASCCTPEPLQLLITPRWGAATLTVTDGASHWPAALLSGLGTPWNTLAPEGRLTLASTGLRIELSPQGAEISGRAQLEIQNFATRLSTLRPLGNYRVQMEGGVTPNFTLSTTSGPLEMNGTGQLRDKRLLFEGRAGAAPGKEDALSNLLNIIGRRDGAQSIITLG